MFKINNPTWHDFFLDQTIIQLMNEVYQKYILENGAVIYPKQEQLFRAFELCDYDQLKVIIIGQDPYHGAGEANGLAFWVEPHIKTPPSLRNIIKKLQAEYPEESLFKSVQMEHWAKQGVLLINSVLSVAKDRPASHKHLGWQALTDRIIQKLSEEKTNLVYHLWGQYAMEKKTLIADHNHLIIETSHPSPFSAHKGFLTDPLFVKTNDYLRSQNKSPIHWFS
jgi:uracil-DNA glycosylase